MHLTFVSEVLISVAHFFRKNCIDKHRYNGMTRLSWFQTHTHVHIHQIFSTFTIVHKVCYNKAVRKNELIDNYTADKIAA